MYARRPKKTFLPGTFIPTPARIVAIIQLCLAFTLLCWNASLPFTGELFSIKSRMLLYKYVMGIDDLKDKGSERLARNADRFNDLPVEQKAYLINGYKELRELSERSFWTKLKRSGEILAFGMSPFEQAWILFSIIISILLLRRAQGSVQVIWILPLLTLLYVVDNQWNGISPASDREKKLFPQESYLVERYLQKPLSKNIFEQKNELELAWKHFLIVEWIRDIPSTDEKIFHSQLEKGEYAFTLARIAALSPFKHPLYMQLRNQEPLPFLAAYIFWNLFFAILIWKRRKNINPVETLKQEAHYV